MDWSPGYTSPQTIRPNTKYTIDQVLRMTVLLVTTTHSNPLCARALNIKSLPGSPPTLWTAICTRSSFSAAPGSSWPLQAGAAA